MRTIIVEFDVPDINEAKQVLEDNADTLEELTREARDAGAQHHGFYATDDGKLFAVDQWESEGAFHRFFDRNHRIETLIKEAGVTSEPKITVLTPMQLPGTF
jgi:hypothetical protein